MRSIASIGTILEWAARPTGHIRTLDAGGDKPIRGVRRRREQSVPRHARHSPVAAPRPDMFRVQLRALRAPPRMATLKVMLPMVTVPRGARRGARASRCREWRRARARSGVAAAARRSASWWKCRRRPSRSDRFDADFFSIGSNDLVQYVTAAAATSARSPTLADPLNPAVLRADRRTSRGRPQDGARRQPVRRHRRRSALCAGAARQRACALSRWRRRRSARVKAAIAAVDAVRSACHERRCPSYRSVAVAEYKQILQAVLESRPSGTRQRLAESARQEPQLRLADLESRLSDADPGAACRDHLRDLPFLARRSAQPFSRPTRAPIRGRLRSRRGAAAHARRRSR